MFVASVESKGLEAPLVKTPLVGTQSSYDKQNPRQTRVYPRRSAGAVSAPHATDGGPQGSLDGEAFGESETCASRDLLLR